MWAHDECGRNQISVRRHPELLRAFKPPRGWSVGLMLGRMLRLTYLSRIRHMALLRVRSTYPRCAPTLDLFPLPFYPQQIVVHVYLTPRVAPRPYRGFLSNFPAPIGGVWSILWDASWDDVYLVAASRVPGAHSMQNR